MPPSSAQRAQQASSSATINDELFLDPMLGTPLSIYIEADVPQREQYVEAVAKHGGRVSPSYSSSLHIIVDPHSESGQSLYRQYVGKKGKLVLGYHWINECIQKNRLQLYAENWAGCRVTGKEQTYSRRALEEQQQVDQHPQAGARRTAQQQQAPQETRPRVQQPLTPQSVDKRQYSAAPQASESQRLAGISPTEAVTAQRKGPASHRGRQARQTNSQAIHRQPAPSSAASQLKSRPALHHTQAHPAPQTTSPQQTLQQPHTPQTQFTQSSAIHPSQTRAPSQILPVPATPQFSTSAFSYQVYATAQPSEEVAVSSSAPAQAVLQHTQQQQTWQTPTPVTPHPQPQNIQHVPARSQHLHNRVPAASTSTTWSEQSPQLGQAQAQPSLEEIQPGYYDDQYQDDNWNDTQTQDDYFETQDTYDSQPPTYQSQQSHLYAPATRPSTSSLQHAIQPQPQATASSSDSIADHDQSPISSPTGLALGASTQEGHHLPTDEPRGRKRTRASVDASKALVLNRRGPPLRSPTPPARVVKSTYGGNLFTAEDVVYLKRYIEYCQSQGLVLSLREICERIAVKAPHHTFYSWRRYCNKHQIRLGGYVLGNESRSPTPAAEGSQTYDEVQQNGAVPEDGDSSTGLETGVFNAMVMTGEGPFTLDKAERLYKEARIPCRSPSPPKALFRSTTGKGVAFTADDVSFLCKYLAYRRLQVQGQVDMVVFWKDVAAKAPHHSRASWMKYYRRHKHELNRADGDAPLVPVIEKKKRYSREDDILLARHFANRPEGTSDQIFQAFAQLYPYHPWKGWQEHYRIHKAKIDHILQEESSVQATPMPMPPSATPQLNGTGDAGIYRPV